MFIYSVDCSGEESDAESCRCVGQWRNKLRSQQYEREKELSDHAVVIKELQKVIGDERIAKEQLDHQVLHSAVLYQFTAFYELIYLSVIVGFLMTACHFLKVLENPQFSPVLRSPKRPCTP